MTLIYAAILTLANDSDGRAFFEQKIRPILIQRCFSCHGPDSKTFKGGLRLDVPSGWKKGGESGEPAIIPGKPNESLLLKAVKHDGLEMPPDSPKIPAQEIADLAKWIAMGAPDPRGETADLKRADASWWSLQPLSNSIPPRVTGPALSPVDAFVNAELAAKNLSMNPAADKRALLRRLTFDLMGLPPTMDEVEAFLADDDPTSYAKVVDRLLASPRYGERWGRHWLDVVRFGESNGYERNVPWHDAWPFRDYVIRSFNDDKPFDRFVIEHLAGDVIAPSQPEVAIGSAFLTLGPYDDVGNQDAVAAANIRAIHVDEITSTAGAAFLGLTFNCARCHHHKFDPIPTEDYYRLKAAFDGVYHGSAELATADQRKRRAETVAPLEANRNVLVQERTKLDAEFAARADRLPTPRPAPSARLTEEKFKPLKAKIVRLNILATTHNPADGAGARIDEFEVWTAGTSPRNVALAGNGGKASGVTGHVAKDFPEAYAIHLVNDGKYSARWFVGSPAVLTIEFAKEETIDRVVFSHDRTSKQDAPIQGLGSFVGEYTVETSNDGRAWTKVADSFDRKPPHPDIKRERVLRTLPNEERERRQRLQTQIAELDAKLAAVPPLPTAWIGTRKQPTETPVVFKGGDPMRKGAGVKPESPSVLGVALPKFSLPENASESERRLALAKWIASNENPLTSRVIANRVWQHHFGTGIVDTPNDFGFLGGKPSHPALLDWLSRRLHQHGWSLKSLHRDVLHSHAYQQSAAFRQDGANADAGARLLWRFPPRRLDAEQLRDSMLEAAGVLKNKMYGPGFQLYEHRSDNVSTYVPLSVQGPETYRRTVYHQNVRASLLDVLTDFDQPDNAYSTPRRSLTTTPLQSLALFNHRFAIDMSKAMERRIDGESGSKPHSRVAHAYRIALQRSATAEEFRAAKPLVGRHGLAALCRALLNSNEFLYLE
jgi:mono/diheme cytochrome c family protein